MVGLGQMVAAEADTSSFTDQEEGTEEFLIADKLAIAAGADAIAGVEVGRVFLRYLFNHSY